MFRLMFNGVVAKKSFDSLTTKFVRNMTTIQSQPQTEQLRPRPENFEATICGRINRMPSVSENGAITFSLVTHNEHDDFYVMHRVLVLKPGMQNYFSHRLTEGQQVYINGSLKYFNFIGEDSKAKKTGCIYAKKLQICEPFSTGSDQSALNSDINEVKLFGRVTRIPHDTEATTFLAVATHSFDRREQLYKPNYHQLMIGREDSLHEAAHSIDVGTRVFVHGSLKTYVQPANDGTKKLVYFIKPNKLLVTQESRDDRAGDDALDNM